MVSIGTMTTTREVKDLKRIMFLTMIFIRICAEGDDLIDHI